MLRLVTESIVLEEIQHSWLQVTIVWSRYFDVNKVDVAFIWRQEAGGVWTQEENTTMRNLYPTAARSTVLKQLPDRSWSAIKTQAQRLDLTRRKQRSDIVLPEWMSFADTRVMREHALDASKPDQRVWWKTVTSINHETVS